MVSRKYPVHGIAVQLPQLGPGQATLGGGRVPRPSPRRALAFPGQWGWIREQDGERLTLPWGHCHRTAFQFQDKNAGNASESWGRIVLK